MSLIREISAALNETIRAVEQYPNDFKVLDLNDKPLSLGMMLATENGYSVEYEPPYCKYIRKFAPHAIGIGVMAETWQVLETEADSEKVSLGIKYALVDTAAIVAGKIIYNKLCKNRWRNFTYTDSDRKEKLRQLTERPPLQNHPEKQRFWVKPVGELSPPERVSKYRAPTPAEIREMNQPTALDNINFKDVGVFGGVMAVAGVVATAEYWLPALVVGGVVAAGTSG